MPVSSSMNARIAIPFLSQRKETVVFIALMELYIVRRFKKINLVVKLRGKTIARTHNIKSNRVKMLIQLSASAKRTTA